MISISDVYHSVAAIVPLYFAMALAYVSVRWLKLFTPDQCSGINMFVARFSIPLLSFQVISNSNPFHMNLKLIFADFLQKLLAFCVLVAAAKISSRGSLKWVITGLSLSTMPNSLILGIPLLRAMYGDDAAKLLAQIVVLQSLIWYNLLLFLFELNATREPYLTSTQDAGGVEGPQETQLKEEMDDTETTTPAGETKIMLILSTVGRKLIRNPNTHATLLGIIWAIIHFRWRVELPKVVEQSISILADGGLGMAMFSLGLFMASRPSIIACGKRKAVLAMALKFMVGPGLMAVSSIAVGIKGTLFKVAIVQAALPQGIVPFVFAKEYNIHPDILSTGITFGLLVAVPIAMAYYFLLAL